MVVLLLLLLLLLLEFVRGWTSVLLIVRIRIEETFGIPRHISSRWMFYLKQDNENDSSAFESFIKSEREPSTDT